jgi:hypothetical protein
MIITPCMQCTHSRAPWIVIINNGDDDAHARTHTMHMAIRE